MNELNNSDIVKEQSNLSNFPYTVSIPPIRGALEIFQVSFEEHRTKYQELITYAKKCSWQGTGRYFAGLLENNEFEDTEKIFIAVQDDNIIGFAGLVNESCVDNTEYAPWLDFLFVDETYRNKGVARRLVEYILMSAKRENISNVYLCTVNHEEMYLKFGFQTLYKTRVNDTDDCFVMKRGLI